MAESKRDDLAKRFADRLQQAAPRGGVTTYDARPTVTAQSRRGRRTPPRPPRPALACTPTPAA